MATPKARNRALLPVALVAGGALRWAGGFLLSSKDSRCIDGPEIHECSGTFSSDAWHAVGLASIMGCLVVVIVGLAIVVQARRRSHSRERPLASAYAADRAGTVPQPGRANTAL